MALRVPKAEVPAEVRESMIEQLGAVPEPVEVLWNYGVRRVDTHTLDVHQQGDLLQLDAERAPAEGSYRWRGELWLWDNEALMGWYRSTDGAVRSRARCTWRCTSTASTPGVAGLA